MSSTVRSIVLRALFEPDFHNLLVTKPDEALDGYSLSPAEIDALKNPSPALYNFLKPGIDELVLIGARGTLFVNDGDVPPQPPLPPSPLPPILPPITVTVTITAVTITTSAATSISESGNVAKRYASLINAIQQSTGAARADLVKSLINELTKDQ